jgi:predicted dinucleotide-binding enzyme
VFDICLGELLPYLIPRNVCTAHIVLLTFFVPRLFVRAGHQVALSNPRGGQGLEDLIEELGDKAHATTIEEAARFGDVVLLAIPFGKFSDLPANAFKGKVVVDAVNYYPERDGVRGTRRRRNDSKAKEIVSRLIEEIGFAAVDSGFLQEGGRNQQPGTAIYGKEVTAKEAAALLSTD